MFNAINQDFGVYIKEYVRQFLAFVACPQWRHLLEFQVQCLPQGLKSLYILIYYSNNSVV